MFELYNQTGQMILNGITPTLQKIMSAVVQCSTQSNSGAALHYTGQYSTGITYPCEVIIMDTGNTYVSARFDTATGIIYFDSRNPTNVTFVLATFANNLANSSSYGLNLYSQDGNLTYTMSKQIGRVRGMITPTPSNAGVNLGMVAGCGTRPFPLSLQVIGQISQTIWLLGGLGLQVYNNSVSWGRIPITGIPGSVPPNSSGFPMTPQPLIQF